MSRLNSEERIRLALEGREVDHVPFSPFLAYVWESYPKAVQDAGQLPFLRRVGADPMWRGAPCPVRAELPETVSMRTWEDGRRIHSVTATPVGELHQVSIRSETGNTAFLFEHPLKCEEDLKVRMWIEEQTELVYDPEAMAEHLAGQGREGLSIGMLLPRGKSAFQSLVEHHIGTEELMYALADYPETVKALWQAMMETNLEATRLACRAPYDYWLTWEDSGTQNYSPRLYDQFIGVEIGQWCELLGEHDKRYIQHACGHVRALVGRMKAHGAYGVESISPPPTGNITLADARAQVGSDFAIIGGIEPTEFLNLTVEELGPYVEQVLEDGTGGPFVLANSDSCPPGVTEEKFRRVAEIAKVWRA